MTVTIEPTTTLAEIVNDHPDLARELERRSLDYCCGGHRTLAAACAAVGLDPTRTATELRAAGTAPPAPWSGLGADELVDHLEATHHAYLHDELPRLAALVTKVAWVHGARHPELDDIEQTYAELQAELEPHLVKEEHVLFPMVRELARSDQAPSFHCGTLRNPISVMLREHDRAGDLLARLRLLSDGYTPPEDGCASYRALYAGLARLEADTHLHVHKENNLLFPLVLELEQQLTVRS